MNFFSKLFLLSLIIISQNSNAQIIPATKTFNLLWPGECACPAGKTRIGSQCMDYTPQISLSSDSFVEGAINNLNLLTVTIDSQKGVKELSGNFKDFFSFAQIKLFQLNEDSSILSAELMDYSFLNKDTLILNKSSKKIKIIFLGAVKYPINKSLDLILKDQDNIEYMISNTISIIKDSQVPDSPSRYLNYNIVAVKGPTASGDSPVSLLDHAQETRRITKGWRIPILLSYSVKEVICNGSPMNYFAAKINNADSNHVSCLQDVKSNEGETVFSFSSAYSSYNTADPSSSSGIGGQAFGLKNGAVIDFHNVRDTLAHELGHNLGLFHTFETIANPVRMKTLTEYHQLYSKANSSDNLPYNGDWYGGRLTSGGIVSLPSLSSIVDDTPIDWFNGKVESSVANISLAAASKVINFSNYTLTPAFWEFSSYGQATNVVYSDFTAQSPTSINGGFMCQSQLNESYTGYQSFCIPGFSLSNSVIENTMSYWRKLPETSFFSSGQKLRMDLLINQPEGSTIGEKR